MSDLSPTARRVQELLKIIDPALTVTELPASTRSAREAALAVGCEVKQIVKSLVFMTAHSGKPILVLASGINRVDEKLLESHTGEPIVKADADFVRKHTGFAIGGVAPLGHPDRLETFIDEDLKLFSPLWAAAGTPNAVFQLTFDALLAITEGRCVIIH